jgi:polysaccharide export outer membrane protein
VWLAFFGLLTLAGCALLPASGPSEGIITKPAEDSAAARAIQVVEVNANVVRQLQSRRKALLFSEVFGHHQPTALSIGAGDTIEISIWEAPPATLFGGGAIDPRNPSTVRATTLPEQVVNREGFVTVPFAGRVRALGRSPREVEDEVRQSLLGKANQPEVLVRVTRNASATVAVVGEVANSIRMPLTASGERVLDALAAAGGVRQPVGRMTLQVSRAGLQQALPLETIIRDPSQNIALRPGDVVTALFQPLSFTALGATGKNEEINFEAQGITLAQALARSGGLQDTRSNPRGVFVFRLEANDAISWPRQPVFSTPEQTVPVVYRIDLKDPVSFFALQGFQIQNKDILYISNAPAAELQKFLNLVFSIAYPVLTTIQVSK